MTLQIIICGAGLGGLSAAIACAIGGHQVIVLEAASELVEVGAGVQITPNGGKLLRAWGMGDQIDKYAAIPSAYTVHRYSGKVLAFEDKYDEKIGGKFGMPFLGIHRGDLQQILYHRALELGVEVRLSHRVVDVIESPNLQVVVESGKKLPCDLVVGADGLWSKCRGYLLGTTDEALPTGDVAYRILLTIDQVEDPELKEWIQHAKLRFWIGPNSHVVAYSLKNGSMYNMVLLVPDDLPNGVSRQGGSLDEMRALFTEWDPILTRFLNCVQKVDKWRLMHRKPLDVWSNKDKNFVLMGDACHPMLPYLAQGANSSLEDGAVLGRVLTRLNTKDQLPRAIAIYEKVRMQRSTAIVAETFKQREVLHLPDGPQQIARDKIFEQQLGKEIQSPFPNRWADPTSSQWLFGYDAYQEADRAVNAFQRSKL